VTRLAETAGLGRRVLCLIYEALLLTAIVLMAGGLATWVAQAAEWSEVRGLTRLVVTVICAGYFAIQWCGRGQTLPMKTWRIRLQTQSGNRLSMNRALLRMGLATIGYLTVGVSILWALLDRDQQFLHDRLAGTRLVTVAATDRPK
jgi:uncharacterized RDD family membrane protein YckC